MDEKKIDLPIATGRDLKSAPARVRELLRDFEGSQRLTEPQLRKARHYYYARAAFADAEIGRLMDWMRARGLLENTIVAMVADHGTDLGDHGLLQKMSFYEPVARVPYMIQWSGLRGGVRVPAPVSTISLLPTVAALAGVTCPRTEAHAVLPGQAARQPVFSEIEYGYQKYRDDQRQVMIRDGQYKMSLFQKRGDPQAYRDSPDGELYDLGRDPLERTNLFGKPTYARVVSQLQARIVEWDRNRMSTGTNQ